MKKTKYLSLAIAASVAISNAFAGEITLHSLDTSLEPVIAEYMKLHPEDKINFKKVSYQSVAESLPIQLASGEGPDISLVTDLGGLAKYYLDLAPYVDNEYFLHEFDKQLDWLRGEVWDKKAIPGFPSAMTVNGAFVNVTLFEQAGIELPKEGATWDEWAEACRKVAKATNTDFPMEMDRSGHRFASLAISEGAELVDENGRPVVDEGLKRAITKFVKWHKDGTMPMDLWGATGGAKTRDNFSDFVNVKTVFYFGGSWKLREVDEKIGDFFDWKVVDAPCGASSCTVMPGGGAYVAFKHTKEPELCAKFIEFAAQEDRMAGEIERAVNIPSSTTLVSKGLPYPDATPMVREGLNSFIRQVPKMPDAAYRFQGWAFQRAMMAALTTRISQVINNELDVDTALSRIESDVNQAIDSIQTK